MSPIIIVSPHELEGLSVPQTEYRMTTLDAGSYILFKPVLDNISLQIQKSGGIQKRKQ